MYGAILENKFNNEVSAEIKSLQNKNNSLILKEQLNLQFFGIRKL
jgi:hypothetical protein